MHVTINIPITLYNKTLFILIFFPQPSLLIKVIVVSVAFEINIKGAHPLHRNETEKRRTSRLRTAPNLQLSSKETVEMIPTFDAK